MLEGVSNFQGNAVVNYTDADTPYTRIIEHKHFEFGQQPDTVISREYSKEWQLGDEPYYPVNDDRNGKLYAKYKALADTQSKVLFGGRLAEYRYYDMHQVIENALILAEKSLKLIDMKEGLVSIITPVYNGEKYISETIESVIKQTYLDWEMIVVDDGSKDGSAAIVRRYAEKESRITLLQQPNGGSASARNNGIRYANGQYIALLDSDDLWDPDFLKSQLALMKEKNTICVHGSYKRINENSEEILKAWKAKKKLHISRCR